MSNSTSLHKAPSCLCGLAYTPAFQCLYNISLGKRKWTCEGVAEGGWDKCPSYRLPVVLPWQVPAPLGGDTIKPALINVVQQWGCSSSLLHKIPVRLSSLSPTAALTEGGVRGCKGNWDKRQSWTIVVVRARVTYRRCW